MAGLRHKRNTDRYATSVRFDFRSESTLPAAEFVHVGLGERKAV